jgi:hypothetical protein
MQMDAVEVVGAKGEDEGNSLKMIKISSSLSKFWAK